MKAIGRRAACVPGRWFPNSRVEGRRPPANSCHEDGLRGGPNLEGRISISFVIGTDGRVSRTKDGGSDVPDAQVVRRGVDAMSGVSFSLPQGGPVRVVYPIMFSPG